MQTLSFSAFIEPNEEHYKAIATSLQEMLDLAKGYGGQARCAKRILLSLYSPKDFQMSGDDLAGLDIPHIHHAIHILHEHGMCRRNVFGLVESCEEQILRLSKHEVHSKD